MKIFYFSEANLRRTPFMKQFVSEFHKFKGKAILLHAPFGKAADTLFVTKRISSLLSEVLVVNMGLSGDQKGLLRQGENGLEIAVATLEQKFQTLQLVVMNTLLSGGEGATADPIEVIQELRRVLPIEEVQVFATNSRSPLVSESKVIDADTDISSWLAVYEEEQAALENGKALAPARLVSATNFSA